jgi:hypothetical protein
LVFATALIAVPGTGTVLVIEAITVVAAAERAGLVSISELIRGQASKGRQDLGPAALGKISDFIHW